MRALAVSRASPGRRFVRVAGNLPSIILGEYLELEVKQIGRVDMDPVERYLYATSIEENNNEKIFDFG